MLTRAYTAKAAHVFTKPNPINVPMTGNRSSRDGRIPHRNFEYAYYSPTEEPKGLSPKWAAQDNPNFSNNYAKAIKKPISLYILVALTFFCVSGGPYGIEDAVASAGPLLTILGLLFLPFLWYDLVHACYRNKNLRFIDLSVS